jgi:DNA-directed RNA polymerase specialized sigma24 family protein
MNWPPDDELREAWRALVADPTTFGPFAELVLDPLTAALARQFPTTDPDDVSSAATDALMWFSLNAGRFNPDLSPLPAFLRMVARGRLLNRRDANRRHREGKIPWDSVEHELTAGNDPVDDDRPSFDSPALRDAVAALPAADREVVELIRDGERRTAAFAAVLGLSDLPPDEQEREVKRAKDRIKARLKRAVGGDHE